MQGSENTAAPSRRISKGIAIVVLLGLAIRLFDGISKSLSIDDLQTLFFTRADFMHGVIGRVHLDFKAPGYYLALFFLRGIDAPLLRVLTVLASLVTLIPLLALCRAGRLSSSARLAVAAVFCLAPYQVWTSNELSPYPILQLVIVSLAWAAFTAERSARTRFLVFAGATALGLNLHYLTVVAVLAIGTARVFVKRPEWLRFQSIFVAGVLGVAAFLPWLLASGESFSHASEGTEVWQFSAADWMSAGSMVPRLFTPMIVSLGEPASLIVKVGFGLFLATLVFCGPRFLRSRLKKKRQTDAPLRGAFLAGVAAFLWILLLSPCLRPRIDEHYFILSAWCWPLIAGLLVDAFHEASRKRIASLFLLASLIAGIGHSLGKSQEDFREAVRVAMEIAGDRHPTYTGVLAQEPIFSDLSPYKVYAPVIRSCEPLDVPGYAKTVVVIAREDSMELQPRKWEPILKGREFDEKVNVGNGLWVYVYSKQFWD